jgi:hypothetical protein
MRVCCQIITFGNETGRPANSPVSILPQNAAAIAPKRTWPVNGMRRKPDFAVLFPS